MLELPIWAGLTRRTLSTACVSLLVVVCTFTLADTAAAGDLPPGGPTTPAVSAGGAHTCAVKTDGTIACWGSNGSGRATPPIGTFTQVSAGTRHTCAVKTDGAIACWGDNGFGEATPPIGTFTQVSAGGQHTCAVKTDGAIVCWGDNGFGEATPPIGTFTQVSAGTQHTCAVKADATIACWGHFFYGQATPPIGTFTQVSAGGQHTCAVKTDGAIACWGSNGSGRATPPIGTFTQVSAGTRHTCAVKTDGAIACWGRDDDGQATPPDWTPPAAPTLTATVPASPANDNNPEIQGTAETGSTISLYTTVDCTGAPAATGTAASFAGAGLTANVPDNNTTTFRATATDAASNVSACSSSSITYTEDSSPPTTTIDTGPTGTINNASPSFTFSADEAASFQCRLYLQAQAAPDFSACSGPGNSHTPASPLTDGDYTFEARATDAANNTGSATSLSFKVVTSEPDEPANLKPVNGITAVAEPVSGVVKVKEPGGRYKVLDEGDSIPTGSLVDTDKGTVRLITEARNKKSTQSAVFYAGIFRFQQPKGKTLVTLTLAGGKRKACGAKRGRASVASTALRSAGTSARKRSSAVVRRLWGRGKGRYKTKGKRGAATVRGTRWLTQDRCDGTFFRVTQGVVQVDDFAKKRDVTLRPGGRYLARSK